MSEKKSFSKSQAPATDVVASKSQSETQVPMMSPADMGQQNGRQEYNPNGVPGIAKRNANAIK